MPATRRLDLRKELRHLYAAARGRTVTLDVPPLRYLMIDGAGDPNTSGAYAQAVEALFSVSYTAKFRVKKGPQALDYAVMPLEGLWWADDLTVFERNDRTAWKWTMMILQPDVATDAVLRESIEDVRRRKALPRLDELRIETFHEGKCAQVLHVGPFTEEGPVIEALHAFIDAQSRRRGRHHEIYLSDIRRAAPDTWKTLIRQPME